MFKYVGRKLLLAIPLVIGVVTLIFVLLELSPGTIADKFFSPETTPEVREMIIAKYGLNDPAISRYFRMLYNLVTFDFGHSIDEERPVFDVIMDALPNTIVLSAVTLLVIYPTGILLGTIQGVRHRKLVDTGISVVSLFFYAMPSFWLAMMLQLLVSYHWGNYVGELADRGVIADSAVKYLTLPLEGQKNAVAYDYMSAWDQTVDLVRHIILPGIAMGLASAAGTARYMRSSLLEVIRQDYIRTARAKGLRERAVVFKHAMRNAMLPIVTLFGLSLPFLFSGAVLVETIFAWPGMGSLIVRAIYAQDTPLIIACFYVFTLIVVAGNLLADFLYAIVDPRIRYD